MKDEGKAEASEKPRPFDVQTIRDIVRGQIAYSEADPGTVNPKTGAPNPGMPPDLLHGRDARDVATYVAKCADVPHCGVG